MTARPGFKGQPFIEQTKNKIKHAQATFQSKDPSVDIEVDGAISLPRIKELHTLGANVFVAGTSTIFQDASIRENANKLLYEVSLLRRIYE